MDKIEPIPRIVPTAEQIKMMAALWNGQVTSEKDDTILLTFPSPHAAFAFENHFYRRYGWQIMLRSSVEDFVSRTTIAVRIEE